MKLSEAYSIFVKKTSENLCEKIISELKQNWDNDLPYYQRTLSAASEIFLVTRTRYRGFLIEIVLFEKTIRSGLYSTLNIYENSEIPILFTGQCPACGRKHENDIHVQRYENVIRYFLTCLRRGHNINIDTVKKLTVWTGYKGK